MIDVHLRSDRAKDMTACGEPWRGRSEGSPDTTSLCESCRKVLFGKDYNVDLAYVDFASSKGDQTAALICVCDLPANERRRGFCPIHNPAAEGTVSRYPRIPTDTDWVCERHVDQAHPCNIEGCGGPGILRVEAELDDSRVRLADLEKRFVYRIDETGSCQACEAEWMLTDGDSHEESCPFYNLQQPAKHASYVDYVILRDTAFAIFKAARGTEACPHGNLPKFPTHVWFCDDCFGTLRAALIGVGLIEPNEPRHE